MRTKVASRVFRIALPPCLLLLYTAPAFGAAIWANVTGGLWRDANNWSGGNLPILGSVYITNGGTKTATMDAEHRGKRTVAAPGPGKVELEMLTVGVGVFNVTLKQHIFRHDEFSRAGGCG